MPKSELAPNVLAELNRQLNHELGAAHSYRALALWCAARNLKGFAAFFGKQALEEHEHATKIAGHLIDRGTPPELGPLAAPRQDFKSLTEVAQHAVAMERHNTEGVNAVFEAALAAKDYPAQVLMHWFIAEQVEEEAWTAEMLERVEGATCAGSVFDLDRHIEALLAGEGEDK